MGVKPHPNEGGFPSACGGHLWRNGNCTARRAAGQRLTPEVSLAETAVTHSQNERPVTGDFYKIRLSQ